VTRGAGCGGGSVSVWARDWNPLITAANTSPARDYRTLCCPPTRGPFYSWLLTRKKRAGGDARRRGGRARGGELEAERKGRG
jgi:hypothetical protein